jgi:molybdate transport system substrate-binding protein
MKLIDLIIKRKAVPSITELCEKLGGGATATPGKTPSGTHMGKVMEQLGIADAMASSSRRSTAACNWWRRGETEIGIYPASEVARVKGLTVVGPLPADINLEIVYGAAATTDSTVPNAASAFAKFMAVPENRSGWKEAGFEPPCLCF